MIPDHIAIAIAITSISPDMITARITGGNHIENAASVAIASGPKQSTLNRILRCSSVTAFNLIKTIFFFYN